MTDRSSEAGGGQSTLVDVVATVHRNALNTVVVLGDIAEDSLVTAHAEAVGKMVEAGRLVQIDDSAGLDEIILAIPGQEQTVTFPLRNGWHAYALTVLAIEQAINERNPGVVPPPSTRLREWAREHYGKDLERFMPPSITLLGATIVLKD